MNKTDAETEHLDDVNIFTSPDDQILNPNVFRSEGLSILIISNKLMIADNSYLPRMFVLPYWNPA